MSPDVPPGLVPALGQLLQVMTQILDANLNTINALHMLGHRLDELTTEQRALLARQDELLALLDPDGTRVT